MSLSVKTMKKYPKILKFHNNNNYNKRTNYYNIHNYNKRTKTNSFIVDCLRFGSIISSKVGQLISFTKFGGLIFVFLKNGRGIKRPTRPVVYDIPKNGFLIIRIIPKNKY